MVKGPETEEPWATPDMIRVKSQGRGERGSRPDLEENLSKTLLAPLLGQTDAEIVLDPNHQQRTAVSHTTSGNMKTSSLTVPNRNTLVV